MPLEVVIHTGPRSDPSRDCFRFHLLPGDTIELTDDVGHLGRFELVDHDHLMIRLETDRYADDEHVAVRPLNDCNHALQGTSSRRPRWPELGGV